MIGQRSSRLCGARRSFKIRNDLPAVWLIGMEDTEWSGCLVNVSPARREGCLQGLGRRAIKSNVRAGRILSLQELIYQSFEVCRVRIIRELDFIVFSSHGTSHALLRCG